MNLKWNLRRIRVQFSFSRYHYKQNVVIDDDIPANAKNQSYFLPDKSVLIVDGEKSNFLYLKSVLSQTMLIICYAESANRALEIIRTTLNIDIILMDLQLPKMDGFELIKLIKQQYSSIRIIVQTAYTQQGEEKRAYDAGCDDFLPKSIDKCL